MDHIKNKAEEAAKEWLKDHDWIDNEGVVKDFAAFHLHMLSRASEQEGKGLTDEERQENMEFWKSAWDDEPTREKVEAELHDYRVILEEVSKVYDTLTMSNISKPNTRAEAVIGEVERIHQQDIDEAVKEALEEQDPKSPEEKVEEIMGIVKEWQRKKSPWTWAELQRLLAEHLTKGN